MNRRDLVLAVLGAAEGGAYSPAQLQKALFLVTQKLPDVVSDGASFSFAPYDYGPFDKGVYQAADQLAVRGLCGVTQSSSGYRKYAATDKGQGEAQQILTSLPENERNYIREVSRWVRSLSFPQLVKSIYKAYPEMRKNSIFVG